ncbi:iron-containing alcohol dehydrogenase [Nitratireductor sp. XY-223]|uniref:iron-containing alcohol dehydrogenase n=1 Tax=Nitratireductor sp. XY-223 TaxID=2561926 RepID=UPI0010AB4CAF|nr:iron-containing alcohol dehydrogenase [Nitratireductor sp. XY-223]
MALITYLTRVHFADGILEEALRSELEHHGRKRPVVIADKGDFSSGFADRLFASFPIRTKAVQCEIPDSMSSREALSLIQKKYIGHRADALIAFGKGRLIGLAQFARFPLAELGSADSKSADTKPGRCKTKLPNLFAVPGIDGLTAAPIVSADHSALTNTRYSMSERLPTAIICDPTLTLGADSKSSASAGVNAITRCIEAYLSNAYNPPADGIALDGLQRSASNLHRVLNDDRLEVRREMMAASLNGALAQQKGIGASQAMGAALSSAARAELDQGALLRLFLPGVLRLNAVPLKDKYQPIRRILGIKPRLSLADGVRVFFDRLPLPARLSEMGVTRKHIGRASSMVVEHGEPPASATLPDRADVAAIMHSVL